MCVFNSICSDNIIHGSFHFVEYVTNALRHPIDVKKRPFYRELELGHHTSI